MISCAHPAARHELLARAWLAGVASKTLALEHFACSSVGLASLQVPKGHAPREWTKPKSYEESYIRVRNRRNEKKWRGSLNIRLHIASGSMPDEHGQAVPTTSLQPPLVIAPCKAPCNSQTAQIPVTRGHLAVTSLVTSSDITSYLVTSPLSL